jgi:hypothetical protein
MSRFWAFIKMVSGRSRWPGLRVDIVVLLIAAENGGFLMSCEVEFKNVSCSSHDHGGRGGRF